MKTKFLLLLVFLLCSLTLFSQTIYHNEWIDYTKTYYKIKLAENKLYRIPFSTLASTDLPLTGNGFQLWYKGDQVPMYVTTDGTMTEGDYLEFYGEQNDGAFDTQLFQAPEWQLHTYKSLFTDTAAYFLTWDNTGENLRYETVENDLTDVPEKEAYFWETATTIKTNLFNHGKGEILLYGWDAYWGEGHDRHYSFADYEQGEGFTGSPIYGTAIETCVFNTPYIYDEVSLFANINYTLVGNSNDITLDPDHQIDIFVHEDIFLETAIFDGFATYQNAHSVSNSSVQDTTILSFKDALPFEDNVRLCFATMTYPRQFNFDNQKNYAFQVNDHSEKYIEISNFEGDEQAVLYDLTHFKRIIPHLADSIYQIHLNEAMDIAGERKLFLSNTTNNIAITTIEDLQAITFTNFQVPENQGNYLIITHPKFLDTPLNPVEAYKNYRSSDEGGNFTTQIVNIEELYNQFAYGIAKHPLSIRSFINLAVDHFEPQYVLLIGKGVTYRKMRSNPTNYADCLVPTYGHPPSDNLLAARAVNSYVPQVPIGRLPAFTQQEIGNYLEKVIAYESASLSPCDNENRQWRKEAIHLKENYDAATLNVNYMLTANTDAAIQEAGFGANLNIFQQTGWSLMPQPAFHEKMNEGVGVLYFRGNSSMGRWKFDIKYAEEYQNVGKYPFMISQVSFLGDIFQNDPTFGMPKDFVFAPQAGAIAFYGKLSFGDFTQGIDDFTTRFYERFTQTNYGLSLGTSIQETIEEVAAENNTYLKLAAQHTIFVGDPAIVVSPGENPDYALSPEDIYFFNPNTGATLSPSYLLLDLEQPEIAISFDIFNLGKAVAENIDLTITAYLDSGAEVVLASETVAAPFYQGTYTLTIQRSSFEGIVLGETPISIAIDASNAIIEDCELNNSFATLLYVGEGCESVLGTIGIDGDPVFCDGSFTTLNLVYASYFTSIEWSNGATNESIEVSEAGNYTVTVTDDNGCSDMASIEVIDGTLPPPTLLANGTLIIDNLVVIDSESLPLNLAVEEIGIALEYTWSTGETGTEIAISDMGEYTVIVTNEFGCQATHTITVEVVTGIESESSNASLFNIYPNPATDFITIEQAVNIPATLTLVNVKGQVLIEKDMDNQQQAIHTSDLPAGTYFLKIKTLEGMWVEKIVKQ